MMRMMLYEATQSMLVVHVQVDDGAVVLCLGVVVKFDRRI
jgi:hypothetical protein